jgi:hypothetical protein
VDADADPNIVPDGVETGATKVTSYYFVEL